MGFLHRPTYGLLVDWLENEYQDNVLAGVESTARKLDVNLITYAGGVLDSRRATSAQRNFLYDLVHPSTVRGLVLMSGTLGNQVGPQELSRYCTRYRPLPMCSIGVELDGIPSILTDNVRGMRALVQHLVEVHGYRRIAFIRGPEANTEAESRYGIFREVLLEHGVMLDPALVTPGDFQASAGAEAVRILLEERHVRFEAIVAASDAMALGAMEALQQRGLRVPSDVAVVGFDDVEAARFAASPLTTVRQPLFDQGAHGLQLVLAASRGEDVDPRVVLRTQLVVRRSCGCRPHHDIWTTPVSSPGPEPLTEALASRRSEVLDDMLTAARSWHGSLERTAAQRLLDALIADLRTPGDDRFLNELDELLTDKSAQEGSVDGWFGVLATLRRATRNLDPDPHSHPEDWDDRWHRAEVLVAQAAERLQARKRLRVERWTRTLRNTGEALSTSLDLESLMEVLATELPELRIASAYLSLFLGATRPSRFARLALACDQDGVRGSGELFPSIELLPQDLLPTHRAVSFVVEPLFFEKECLGFVLFESGTVKGVVYEHLRDQISSALRATILFQQVIDEAAKRQLAEKERLEGEMRIASHIQSALAPRSLYVENLEVAATLVPASDVGGDYFDVVPVDDGAWLGIGDVSGTGLRAGLVMLMLQSAVSATVRALPGEGPEHVLRVVNEVLYDNVRRRMERADHVTLTLFHYRPSGLLLFAGHHQPVIVCRERTGRCELLPTPGSFLGVTAELGDAGEEQRLQLEAGDLVVLHTDGVVEAANAQHEALGRDRLCMEIERHRTQPVAMVRDRLLALVRSWTSVQHDDWTIFVARYRGNGVASPSADRTPAED